MSFPDRDVDYRVHPELYEVGRGERGVFGVQPYKGELLPLWTIRTPQEARKAAAALTARFEEYGEAGDFVGMDMARKYLQMGYTRARRYANYRGGRKHDPDGAPVPFGSGDPIKAEVAEIYRVAWRAAAADPHYTRMKGERRASH